jgi:hypothetical protein
MISERLVMGSDYWDIGKAATKMSGRWCGECGRWGFLLSGVRL